MTISHSEYFINMTEEYETLSDISDLDSVESTTPVSELSYSLFADGEDYFMLPINIEGVVARLVTPDSLNRFQTMMEDENNLEDMERELTDLFIDDYQYFDVLSYELMRNDIDDYYYEGKTNISIIVTAVRKQSRQLLDETKQEIEKRFINKAKKIMFNIIEAELLATALHPLRIGKLIDHYGFDGMIDTVG